MRKILEKIRHERQARGLSQENLADTLHLTQASYCRLENGQTELSLAKLVAIARALAINPWELLSVDPCLQPGLGQDAASPEDLLRLIGHLEEEVGMLRSQLAKATEPIA
ncbi:MAG: helix-turn-helix domain-containing protein [Bernardetiaceae bacterium]|jgi:transcriptional regulator with XRE-family HTH domain|nr:helix-turn-helix domain-containing protein [Bernardetiaceae bacterium]